MGLPGFGGGNSSSATVLQQTNQQKTGNSVGANSPIYNGDVKITNTDTSASSIAQQSLALLGDVVKGNNSSIESLVSSSLQNAQAQSAGLTSGGATDWTSLAAKLGGYGAAVIGIIALGVVIYLFKKK